MLFCVSDGFHRAAIFARNDVVLCIDAAGLALISSQIQTSPVGPMVSDNDIVGYTIGYDQEDIHFPIYAMTAFAVALIAAGIVKGVPILAVVGLLPAAVAFYHLPLIERGQAPHWFGPVRAVHRRSGARILAGRGQHRNARIDRTWRHGP